VFLFGRSILRVAMLEFARYVTFLMRLAITVLLSLIIVLNIILFILSVLQANSPNAAEKFPTSVTEHWAYNKENSNCSSDWYTPYRFMHYSDTNQTLRYEYCSWTSNLTWWRSVSMILLSIGAALFLPVLSRKSPTSDSAAIWQNPKNVLRGLLLPTGVCGINQFLLMCFDGGAVNQSEAWCSDWSNNPVNAGNPLNCDYTPFIVTVIFDFILFVFWGLVVLLIFLRQLKRFRAYQEFQDEDDNHEMLEHGSSSGYKKKSGKSWLDKHLKKAKERVKGRK